MEDVFRGAARLLVLTAERQVLLMRLEPSFRDPFWVTPGGGLDEGETYEQAALRELAEEVGRSDLAIGPCVWMREVTFTWERWRAQPKEATLLFQAAPSLAAATVLP